MRGGALDAISVVDSTFSGLVINVEVLEVVVEVDRASTEVPPEEGGVGGEDGGYVYVTLATEWDCKACLPLVEVRDDSLVEPMGDVLWTQKCESIKVINMRGRGDGE